jgi:hypothetical protein
MTVLLRMEFGRWLAFEFVMPGGYRAARFLVRRSWR